MKHESCIIEDPASCVNVQRLIGVYIEGYMSAGVEQENSVRKLGFNWSDMHGRLFKFLIKLGSRRVDAFLVVCALISPACVSLDDACAANAITITVVFGTVGRPR